MNINIPRRRSHLQDLYQMPSQAAGPDIEPMPMMMPQMQMAPLDNPQNGALSELAGMGTQRAMGLIFKKKKQPDAPNMDFLKSFIFS
ncbi:MAG TPA: hypothetical protein VN256_13140 [Pyrinomonadaceae bacterium]|nr:hypothetical protein [Pyrinomonadaceae bacterium]